MSILDAFFQQLIAREDERLRKAGYVAEGAHWRDPSGELLTKEAGFGHRRSARGEGEAHPEAEAPLREDRPRLPGPEPPAAVVLTLRCRLMPTADPMRWNLRLRRLLKHLGRVYGWQCVEIEFVEDTER